MSRPVEERVADERCLDNLTHTATDDDTTHFTFRATGRGNSARFRPGDHLTLHTGEPGQSGHKVTLVAEDERSLTFKPDSYHALADAALAHPGPWLLDESFFDASTLLRKGLDQALSTDHGRERVLALFAGTAQTDFAFADLGGLGGGLDDLDEAMAQAADTGLNTSQADALAQAITAPHCHLVQGPPGTGKTHVLAQTVAALVGRGERVLVTAFTHRAIHNALAACARTLGGPHHLAKISVPQHDPALGDIPQFEYFSRCPLKHQPAGYAVGATPYAAFTKRLAGVTFDTVIIDEASQMTVPLAVLALLKGRRFLFFGDHQQLPPVLLSIPKNEAPTWSVFGALARTAELTTLTTTYRMNAGLAAWPSQNFYSGDLHSHPDVAAATLTLTPRRNPAPQLAPTPSTTLLTVPHHDRRTVSPEEADAVRTIVEDAVSGGLAPSNIGIVTPFRRQARLIKSTLRKSHLLRDGQADQVTTDTVERFQGQERELVIVSFTASDHTFVDTIADFFYQQQRLNVTVTRARTKLVLVASPHLLKFRSPDPDLTESVDLFLSLFEPADA